MNEIADVVTCRYMYTESLASQILRHRIVFINVTSEKKIFIYFIIYPKVIELLKLWNRTFED